MTDEQEQPVKKPISYEPVQDAEVHVECGDSTEEQINYEPKPEAEVFIEKGAKNQRKMNEDNYSSFIILHPT